MKSLFLFEVEDTTAAVGVAIPDPMASGLGAEVLVRDKSDGTSAVTVTPVSGTIDGDASAVVPAGSNLRLMSDGEKWMNVGGGGGSSSAETLVDALADGGRTKGTVVKIAPPDVNGNTAVPVTGSGSTPVWSGVLDADVPGDGIFGDDHAVACKVRYIGQATVQLISGLTVAIGDMIYLSSSQGLATNVRPAFTARPTCIGRVVDASPYGTDETVIAQLGWKQDTANTFAYGSDGAFLGPSSTKLTLNGTTALLSGSVGATVGGDSVDINAGSGRANVFSENGDVRLESGASGTTFTLKSNGKIAEFNGVGALQLAHIADSDLTNVHTKLNLLLAFLQARGTMAA